MQFNSYTSSSTTLWNVSMWIIECESLKTNFFRVHASLRWVWPIKRKHLDICPEGLKKKLRSVINNISVLDLCRMQVRIIHPQPVHGTLWVSPRTSLVAVVEKLSYLHRDLKWKEWKLVYQQCAAIWPTALFVYVSFLEACVILAVGHFIIPLKSIQSVVSFVIVLAT